MFRLLLTMEARPDLFSSGRGLNIVRDRRTSMKNEFWTPNVIGQNFRVKREGPSGTGDGTNHVCTGAAATIDAKLMVPGSRSGRLFGSNLH